MTTFHAIPLVDLSSSQIETYKQLSIPSSHFLFHEKDAFAFEARRENTLIGLILAQAYPSAKTAQLYSIEVVPEFRQQGIGTALFAYFQDYLVKEKKIQALGFEYDQASPFSTAIEKIVAKNGWVPPHLYLLRFYFNVPAFNAPWYQRHQEPPKDCTVFKWGKLNSDEKRRILYMEDQGMFLPYLSPYHNEETIEPINSLGLRYHGKIMGWCITHRRDPETISYSALFIDSDLHMTGTGIALLCQSIKLQQASSVPYGVFEVNLRQINRPWKLFIHKRLKPYASKTERMKWATRVFV